MFDLPLAIGNQGGGQGKDSKAVRQVTFSLSIDLTHCHTAGQVALKLAQMVALGQTRSAMVAAKIEDVRPPVSGGRGRQQARSPTLVQKAHGQEYSQS
jgi:hypothetical protein